MIYKIVVDKQPMNNPSQEKREYEIDIEELRYKYDVYDSLVITMDEDYVMRRLELNEYDVLVELNPPVKQPLPNVNIELFDGDNYIYLYQKQGNEIVAQYLVKNEFNELYVTESQMTSAIKQSATEIELVVSRTVNDDINSTIISRINQSAEQIGIQANKLKLEGYTTINGGFSVDLNGNASIANGTVKINNQGIQMADNSKILGGQGIYTNLYFPSLEFQEIGYSIFEPYSPVYETIEIGAYIPSNFNIVSAKMILQLHPVTWNYNKESHTESQVGYARNIRVYYEKIISGSTVTPISVNIASEFYDYRVISNNSNTLNATGTNNKMSVFESSDLSSVLEKGQTTLFQLRTSNAPNSFTDSFFGNSDYSKARAARTCMGRAMLVVIGYTNPT